MQNAVDFTAKRHTPKAKTKPKHKHSFKNMVGQPSMPSMEELGSPFNKQPPDEKYDSSSDEFVDCVGVNEVNESYEIEMRDSWTKEQRSSENKRKR